MNYDFVDNVLIGYKKLHTNYDVTETEKLGCRNVYKFSFELYVVYEFLMTSHRFPKLQYVVKTFITSQYQIEFQSNICTHSTFFASNHCQKF